MELSSVVFPSLCHLKDIFFFFITPIFSFNSLVIYLFLFFIFSQRKRNKKITSTADREDREVEVSHSPILSSLIYHWIQTAGSSTQ